MPALGTGAIILEEAYALSKMTQSASWHGLLRGGIIPSDVDLCFDNDGSIIYLDFSNSCESWEDVKRRLKGQRRLYENMIRNGPHCAALCKHSVAPEMNRKIDTLHDVERFHIMIWDFGPVLSPIYDGKLWKGFVMQWVNAPDGAITNSQTYPWCECRNDETKW